MKRPVAALVCIAMAHLAPATAPGKDAETAVLKVFDGDSVIVIDKVTRQDRQLTVNTDSIGRARFEMEIELTSEEGIAEARVRIWPEEESDPAMDVTAKVTGEWLFWGHTGTDPTMKKVPKDTLIYIPPSPTAMEQTIRHALALRDNRDTVSLTVWTPYHVDEVHDAEVRFPAPGKAELIIFDATYTLSIDDEGNILSGRVDPVGHTISRD